jgi:hypothetical protein
MAHSHEQPHSRTQAEHHDDTKRFRDRVSTKLGAGVIAVLTAGLLAGCGGPNRSSADHVPTSPSVSASATPGSNETSPAPSETSTAPEVKETLLTNSEVFNKMTAADQAMIEKDIKLSFDDFDQLDAGERSKVALVLMDAHSTEYLQAAGELVVPGNFGRPLKDIYSPATGQHHNVALEDYQRALASTPDKITATDNSAPYMLNQFETAIAFYMAKSGDPQLLEDAKKIVGGALVWQGDGADAAHGDLNDKIKQLEQVSSNKQDDAKYLRFPNAGTASHYFTIYLEGQYKNKPNGVVVGFQVYDPTSQSSVAGPNEDGMTACSYAAAQFPLKNGTQQANWTLEACTDGTIGAADVPTWSLVPNQ